MLNKKKIIIPTLVLTAVLGAGAYGISQAKADDSSSRVGIVEKIVQKFGLNQSDVQAVFDADRTEMQQARQADFEKKLDEAVSKGDLTSEQKDKIIAKKAEMTKEQESNRANMQNLTQEERDAQKEAHQAADKTEREALKTWAQENGIDMKFLMDGMGGRQGGEGAGQPNN